ncbi:MAG: hypothetical protein KGQ41_08715 [Alphaproteobacteria bacterium]|nr:hypothetical protein [Alphaproteobacteria bacterium]
MQSIPAQAGAGLFALCIIFGASADAAQPKSKAPTAPADTAGLAQSEIKAGFKSVKVGNEIFAHSTEIVSLCNGDKTTQLVVPVSIVYNATAAVKANILPKRRVELVQALQLRAMESLASVAVLPTGPTLVSKGLARGFVSGRLSGYAEGLAKGSGLEIKTRVMGHVILTEGCGTISNPQQYGEELARFMDQIRKTRKSLEPAANI